MKRKRSGGWIHFEDHMPDQHRKLLVTNNLAARDAYGEMSHLWLVRMVHAQETGEVTAYNGASLVRHLTHWRYAIPTKGAHARADTAYLLDRVGRLEEALREIVKWTGSPERPGFSRGLRQQVLSIARRALEDTEET